MIGGRLRSLGIGLTAILVSACMETAPGPDPDPPGLTLTTPALAFEPVTGIPEERTAVLAEALVSGAVERGISVVPREADDAVYRVQGYFSAARAGSVTEVSFAWDIFDRAEARVHRIAGTETIQATVPDPWRAVTDNALRRVAGRTVDELQTWLANRATTATRPSAAAPSAQASGVSALLGERHLAPGSSGLADPRLYLEPVEGAGPQGAAALARELAVQLSAFDMRIIQNPAQADFLISGEAILGPAHDDAQTIAIIWSIARPGGERLGTVRQVRRVAAGKLDADWDASARDAAGAAAPGLVNLIQGSDT